MSLPVALYCVHAEYTTRQNKVPNLLEQQMPTIYTLNLRMLRNVVDGTADPRHKSPSALTNSCKQHHALFTMHFVQPFYKSTTETAHLTCTFSH